MKVAILLKNENFRDEDMVQAYTFTIQDNTVTGIGSELLFLQNIDYLFSWLMGKRIDVLYTNNESEHIKALLKQMGIKLRKLQEIKESPLSYFLDSESNNNNEK